ncbi:MAG TPA: hypothetical protein VEX60_14580 [Pyrinomonadaceae bacterium]|nr:hypothetical protein [Pyrinomonadaceae bacterium]
MAFDWQSIAVALIVAAALFYVARRGLARLRSFRGGAASVESSCATGCGNCGDEKAAARPANVLIQIRPSRGGGQDKSA